MSKPKPTKSVNEMSGNEQMQYWIDIADGKYDLSDYEPQSIKESVDGNELTFFLKKKEPNA